MIFSRNFETKAFFFLRVKMVQNIFFKKKAERKKYLLFAVQLI